MADKLLGAVTSFLTNKIPSTSSEFEECLIDIANLFSEFDGQLYDYQDVTNRFLVLSDRPVEVRDPGDFRDEYGAYMFFLGIIRVVAEENRWVWRLTSAASKLLCNEEPNVRAFVRVQLSLFQYPALTGVTYHTSARGAISVGIQGNAKDELTKLINSKIKVVPLRLILKSLHVKSELLETPITEVFLTYEEINVLFNHPLTATQVNPTENDIRQVLSQAATKLVTVKSKLYRNFHIFERTGVLKRVPKKGKGPRFALAINLDPDIESTELKWHVIRTIMSMESFYNDFYDKPSHQSLEEHLKHMGFKSRWTNYYDGGQLPESIYSSLTGKSMETVQETLAEIQITRLPLQLSTEQISAVPPLQPRQYRVSASRLYKALSHNADPEVTRLKHEKSNTYHRHLVELLTGKLQSLNCQPRESVYIDLAGRLEKTNLLFEIKSCNQKNLTSQIRKAVSQVYEYRYRYRSDFPENSSILCVVLQEAPDAWWINYLVEDRKINVMWLVGDINFACSSICHPLIRRLVDDPSN